MYFDLLHVTFSTFAAKPIQHVYGLPTIYKDNATIFLSWKIIPANGFLVSVKCKFALLNSEQENQVLEYHKQKEVYQGLWKDRASVKYDEGFFNISIKKARAVDKGRYWCQFTSEEERVLSDTVHLASYQGEFYCLLLFNFFKD